MAHRRKHSDERGIAVARLSGAAQRLAGPHGAELAHAAKVDELRAISPDPDVLAEVAAFFIHHDRAPYTLESAALQLLVDAGADPATTATYVEAKLRMHGLGGMGDAASRLPRYRQPG